MKAPPHIRVVALVLSMAGVASCAASADSATGNTSGGGGGGGCLTSDCVGVISMPAAWAIEIDPPGTANAALTELLPGSFGSGTLTLTADAPMSVGTTFTAGAGGTVPSAANVVLTFAPSIGGRPDLTYEAPAKIGSSTSLTTGSLTVPSATMGRSATLQLIPLSPADQQIPPTSFAATIASTLAEMLPASYPSISGSVVAALAGTPPIFIARAFQSGTQVSTAPATGADGTFQLLLSPSAAAGSVIVELTPQNQGGADPWYTSSAVQPGINSLNQIVLPAYSQPNAFTLTVEGSDDPASIVGGALVRAQATLASSAVGATDYSRAGTTGADGTVTLSLLPGTATTARDYALTVIPPGGSLYATRCIPVVGVTVGGTTTAPVSLLTVELDRRPVLTGTVTNAEGAPVGSVAITATAGPGATSGCANTNTPAVSSSTHANEDGTFQLPLDPGTYQLDYDPPAGSSAPRLTESEMITISAGEGQISHPVNLPAAGVVQGTVSAPDGSPLTSATIRIFEVRCTSQAGDCSGSTRTAPWLRAQTATDATGTFRAVVPIPGAAN
jgi:hypothetical protein